MLVIPVLRMQIEAKAELVEKLSMVPYLLRSIHLLANGPRILHPTLDLILRINLDRRYLSRVGKNGLLRMAMSKFKINLLVGSKAIYPCL